MRMKGMRCACLRFQQHLYLPQSFRSSFGSRILLPLRHVRNIWSCRLPANLDILLIQRTQRQIQELMLILPPNISLLELFSLLWLRRRLGDFRNQVRCRCLRNSVDQHTEEGCFEDDEEGKGEAVEDAFAVVEPGTLLEGGVIYAGEVGFELVRCC